MTDEIKLTVERLHEQAKALEKQAHTFGEMNKHFNRRTFKGTKTEELAEWMSLCVGVKNHSLEALESLKAKIQGKS